MAKTSLGKLKPEAIGITQLPRPDRRTLEGFRALGDLTGTVSDALDECEIAGAIAASLLRPTDPRARIVGQAITVLNRKLTATRRRGARHRPFALDRLSDLVQRAEPDHRQVAHRDDGGQ